MEDACVTCSCRRCRLPTLFPHLIDSAGVSAVMPAVVSVCIALQVREYNATGRGCISTMLDTKVGRVTQACVGEELEQES